MRNENPEKSLSGKMQKKNDNDTNDNYKLLLLKLPPKVYGAKNQNWVALLVGHRVMIEVVFVPYQFHANVEPPLATKIFSNEMFYSCLISENQTKKHQITTYFAMQHVNAQ